MLPEVVRTLNEFYLGAIANDRRLTEFRVDGAIAGHVERSFQLQLEDPLVPGVDDIDGTVLVDADAMKTEETASLFLMTPFPRVPFLALRIVWLVVYLTADFAGSRPSHFGIPSRLSPCAFFPKEPRPPSRIDDGKTFFLGRCVCYLSLICAYFGLAA